jgi:hypothetical protein
MQIAAQRPVSTTLWAGEGQTSRSMRLRQLQACSLRPLLTTEHVALPSWHDALSASCQSLARLAMRAALGALRAAPCAPLTHSASASWAHGSNESTLTSASHLRVSSACFLTRASCNVEVKGAERAGATISRLGRLSSHSFRRRSRSATAARDAACSALASSDTARPTSRVAATSVDVSVSVPRRGVIAPDTRF